MRCIVLFALLLPASSAYASPSPGTFGGGYITSYETLTPRGTYVNALGTLSNPSLSGFAGWYSAPSLSTYNSCMFGFDGDSVECGPYACGGYNYIGISWSRGSMAPQTDDLSAPGSYGIDCQLGDAVYSWDGANVYGYVEALDDGMPSSSINRYEGIQLNFVAPDVPASAPWLVDPNFWSGSGNFWYTESDGSTETGFQGTFNIYPIQEPATLALFGLGLVGVGFSWRRLRV